MAWGDRQIRGGTELFGVLGIRMRGTGFYRQDDVAN